jgi:ferrochelatase
MQAVLLLAHGTPDSLDDIPEYLRRVRGGRPAPPELIAEMTRHYAAIGGRSPLTEITLAQARALERALDGVPVYVGMRNWRPFIADAVAAARQAGVTELLAIPLAPQYSSLSVGKYRGVLEAARPPELAVRFVESWHDHPGLIEAFAQKVTGALERHRSEAVLFTAHSLPIRVIEDGDPYRQQVLTTAQAVARWSGLASWRLAWQSAGRTPEPWLGPSVEEALRELAKERVRSVLIAPVGFVSDHTEVLYDIDVQARAAAGALGVSLFRTESLNTSPTFVRALADLVRAPGA